MSNNTLTPTMEEYAARKADDCQNMIEPWPIQFPKMGAIWEHDGNPLRPHVRFAGGGHSNGFFNSEVVAENATILDAAAFDLVRELIRIDFDLDSIDRVVGSKMGAVFLAQGVARNVGHRRQRHCLRAYTELIRDQAGNKTMVFPRTSIRRGEKVLVVEDGVTTGGSLWLIDRAVKKSGGVVLPIALVMMNSSGRVELDGRRIISLVDNPLPHWDPNDPDEGCPLCRAGSVALYPAQEIENWALLNAKY